MIDVNELRIGNWITMKDGTPFRTGVGRDVDDTIKEEWELHVIKQYPENYEAIPVTEEWIAKFGFAEDAQTLNSWTNSKLEEMGYRLIHRLVSPNGYTLMKGNVVEGRYNTPTVHKLQNAYFKLTEEELEMNG